MHRITAATAADLFDLAATRRIEQAGAAASKPSPPLLRQRGFEAIVSFAGDETRLPADAKASLQRARDAGVVFASEPPAHYELAIDALLGIGVGRPPQGTMADWLRRMHGEPHPVLAVDVPSGLNADTGTHSLGELPGQSAASRRICLSLLTLKPGLFTAQGRDAAGEIWFDDLGCGASDGAVIGGASGMAGAALLAGSAALHAGAGRT
ncbi:NAD(P)H-hydrate epimerase, partial [Variovorax sp. CT11-76]